MSLFVDTSALYALLDEDDEYHELAVETLRSIERQASELLTHDYVVVETTALVQRRLGMSQVRTLHERVLPAIRTVTISPEVRQAGIAVLLAAGRRDISLVDWISFEVMRRGEVDLAFAFDSDFADQGFTLIP